MTRQYRGVTIRAKNWEGNYVARVDHRGRRLESPTLDGIKELIKQELGVE